MNKNIYKYWLKELSIYFVLMLIFFGLFAIVGTLEAEDAMMEEKRYCKEVKLGIHEDFANIYKKACI